MLWLCTFADDEIEGWKYFPEVKNLFTSRTETPTKGFLVFFWWFFSLVSSYLSDLVIQSGTQDGFLDQLDHTCLSLVPSRDILGLPELSPTRASLIAEKHSTAEPTHQPVGTFSNEPLNGKCTDNTGIKWAPLIDFPNQYGTGAPSLCHLLPLPGGILRPFIILIRHYTWHKCWVD